MKTRARRHPVSLLAGPLLALALLSACGGDSEVDGATDPAAVESSSSAAPTESPSETPTESASPAEPPKGPACDEIWVDGAKLPGGYQECYSADKRVKADGRYCEFGKPLVTYDNRFWAVPGGPIHEVDGTLLDDDVYRQSLMKCGG